MVSTNNPWFTTSAPAVQPAAPPAVVEPTGATAPQPTVTPPETSQQLPTWAPTAPARVWVVGAHGGAGETTLAHLLEGTATRHRWPNTHPEPPVLLVARTHANGLAAAQLAMRAWAAAETPLIRLLGLVLVADAPGRLPKPLADRAEVLRGGVPHMWHVPWVDAYRLQVAPTNPPRQVRKVLNEINTVLTTTH